MHGVQFPVVVSLQCNESSPQWSTQLILIVIAFYCFKTVGTKQGFLAREHCVAVHTLFQIFGVICMLWVWIGVHHLVLFINSTKHNMLWNFPGNGTTNFPIFCLHKKETMIMNAFYQKMNCLCFFLTRRVTKTKLADEVVQTSFDGVQYISMFWL